MRFNTLSDWLSWQEQLHPETIELGLERVSLVWSRLHADKFECPVISVAGTNGKGSSVAMLASIYSSAGYVVGVYSSPHLWKYNERIQINGKDASDALLCESFDRIDKARGETSLTYFEFGTLAALDIFQRHNLDVIVLEVGLGGRLDAVNIIDADVALVTSLDLDHQQWLGDNIEAIAREKAGIIRGKGVAVLSGKNSPEYITGLAREMGAKTYAWGEDFSFTREEGNWVWEFGNKTRYALPCPGLAGEHQLQNAAGVVMVIEALKHPLPVGLSHLREGLFSTWLPGRCSYHPGPVPTLFDVAHNPAAAERLSESLAMCSITGKVHAVFSCLADKDIANLFTPLCAQVDHWYIADLDVPRSAKSAEMQTALVSACPDAGSQLFASITMAYEQAQENAETGDIVVIYGSFYTVGQVIEESTQAKECL